MIEVGDLFKTACELSVPCKYDWRGSSFILFAASIPAGEILVCQTAQENNSSAVLCRPVRYRELLSKYVPWKFRLQFWRFHGYMFVIPVTQLKRECEFVGKSSLPNRGN